MRRLVWHLVAIAAWLLVSGLWSDAAYIPIQTIVQTPANTGLSLYGTPLGSVGFEGLPGQPYGGVGSIQGVPLGWPVTVTPSGPVQTVDTPSTLGVVSGTANTTGTTSTLIIQGVPSKRIYVTAFSCANTGSTTSLTSFQDGSGGTTIWTTINPTVSGSNAAQPRPLFWTSPGNGVYFVEGSASSTAYCSAAGFAS